MEQKVDETAKGMDVYEVTALAYGFEFLSLTVGEATWVHIICRAKRDDRWMLER